MAQYFAFAPVTLTLTVVVGKKTAGGKLAASDVMVTSIDGKPSGNDGVYYAFAGQWGDVVLNFKETGRPAKPVKAEPKALTPAQIASIPGPATKPVKGKAKAAPVAPAPEAPAAPDLAAMMAMLQSMMAAQK
jgi:hypothetical protein